MKKEIFDSNERHDTMDLPTNKYFLSTNYTVDFSVITAVISLLDTSLAIYLLCKH